MLSRMQSRLIQKERWLLGIGVGSSCLASDCHRALICAANGDVHIIYWTLQKMIATIAEYLSLATAVVQRSLATPVIPLEPWLCILG